MKQPHSLLIAGIILCMASGIGSQDLHLTSGKKTKTIKAGTFIQVQLPVPNQEPCVNCPINSMSGQLISYGNGKLNLLVKRSVEPLSEGNTNVGYLNKNYTDKGKQPTLDIPRDAILSITKKGKNKVRDLNTGEIVAHILFLLGAGHMISAPIAGVTDDQTGESLLRLGAIEIATSMFFNSIVKQKTYVTSEDYPNKKTGKKIWVLN